MSLCDKCFAPGACCKRLFLGGATPPNFPTTTGEQAARNYMRRRNLPFVPNQAYVMKIRGRDRQVWNWNCTKLDEATGRCTIYEDRPVACRSYEPASDGLCVHFNGAEAGDPTVPIGD